MWYNLLKYVQTKQFGGGVVYWHGKVKKNEKENITTTNTDKKINKEQI